MSILKTAGQMAGLAIEDIYRNVPSWMGNPKGSLGGNPWVDLSQSLIQGRLVKPASASEGSPFDYSSAKSVQNKSTGNPLGDVLGAQDTNNQRQPANNNNNGGQGNYWSDEKNEGYYNGQLYRDANEWRKASGMDPYSGGGASDEVRRREEETRRGINSGYDQYESGLRGLQGSYEGERDSSLASAADVYDKIFGGLNEQKQANVDKLAAGRTAVDTRRADSIKDLKSNLSNTVRGMSMQMGAMGAGDTSAAKVMMPYAYTKIAGQQEGGIQRQANEQLFEIDQEERNTNLAFSQMWKDTEVEKTKELDGIRERYGTAIRNVQTALAQAPLDRQRELASLSQSLLQEALANLRTAEARIEQDRKDIKTWATNRLSALNDAKIQLSGNANFSPRDIVFDELKMAGSNPTMADVGGYDWNPLAAAKKVRDEYYSA